MMFIMPINKHRITSNFGWRKINKGDGKGLVNEWHQGLDLSSTPNTNVTVMAAADGEVLASGALGTYGNRVLIRHNIDGKHYETLYAHLKTFNVKKGDKVKQGDVIGIMGNTGVGTGIHLHFEVHIGPWVTGQLNAVDPLKWIGKLTESELYVARMENKIKELQKQLLELEREVDFKQDKYISKKEDLSKHWGKDAIFAAINKGVMTKDKEGKFHPDRTLTRAELAQVLKNLGLI